MSKQPQKPAPTKSQQNLLFVAGLLGGMAMAAILSWVLYRTANPAIAAPAPVQQAAAAPVAQQPEVHDHEHNFQTIEAEELKKLFEAKAVTIIDVRDLDSFGAGHIPGAMQIPLTRIEGEIPYLPRDKTIVTYCTCPAEESSGQAAMILANGGITNVKALRGGLEAWAKLGLPTETGVEAPKV